MEVTGFPSVGDSVQFRGVHSEGEGCGVDRLFMGGASSDPAAAEYPCRPPSRDLGSGLSPLPALQRCVGQFSIPKVTKRTKQKHLRGTNISKGGPIYFYSLISIIWA